MATLRLKVVVNGPLLAKMVKKAVTKIEAVPEEKRVEAFAEWAARIVHDCVRLEDADGVQDVSKDSQSPAA